MGNLLVFDNFENLLYVTPEISYSKNIGHDGAGQIVKRTRNFKILSLMKKTKVGLQQN